MGKVKKQGSASEKHPAKAKRSTKSPAALLARSERPFPIVGIGASAGGLEAFEQLFTHMPAESGMAFVLIPHLDPSHVSILPELIRKFTQMKIHMAEDGMKVEPDNIYVIPSGRFLAIFKRALQLMQPVVTRGVKLPIDSFFRSLAQDQKENAIAIILSGTGTDGTLGLRDIKGEGGMVMAQDPESAKYDGMPRSAIATGLVDYTLPPEKMPEQLVKYARYAVRPRGVRVTAPKGGISDVLPKVFTLLRAQTGHDFSSYKRNTIIRRIERRMNVHQIDGASVYTRYLEQNPREVEALFKELLIGVTSFFRDREAFEVLKHKILPKLLESKSRDDTVRIWVPACSSGEEAYSIAIILRECMTGLSGDFKAQIFGTDIDASAIDVAREGHYPASISADVSEDRLNRFFTREDDVYRIKKNIREMLVLAPHNIIHDPPFTKLDMVCCRNLLIYMDTELQQKVLPIFHYSLRPEGILFLGSSETIGPFVDLFGIVDKKWKIFRRKESALATHLFVPFPYRSRLDVETQRETATKAKETVRISLPKEVERILLEHCTPACAVINEKGDIAYIHGRTGKYLEPAAGAANLNVLAMARPGLKTELTTAIRQAAARKQSVTYEGLKVKDNGGYQWVDVTVNPITEPEALQGTMMVLFRDAKAPAKAKGSTRGASTPDVDQRIADLERDLAHAHQSLQTTIEELEVSNEEMKSANEELQSANEELQSTNEELETSKEELQSLNEELVTVNAELQGRIEELSKTNDDMQNLLNSTNIATIFLDRDMRISRFTPKASLIFPLVRADIDRPINHIVSNLKYEGLVEDAHAVLDTLLVREKELQGKDGRWYLMRITPYRTVANVIDGVAVTFDDVTNTRALIVAQAAQEYAEHIIDTVREPLVVLNGDLRVASASRAFYRVFQVTPAEAEGKLIYEVGNRQWDIPELRRLLGEVLPMHRAFDDFELEHDFPTIGRRVMRLNGREIPGQGSQDGLILLAIEDITN